MATAAAPRAAGKAAPARGSAPLPPVKPRSSVRKPSPVGHLVGYARVSTAEQDPALQDYYPDLTGDDEIVIVSFEVDHPRLPQR